MAIRLAVYSGTGEPEKLINFPKWHHPPWYGTESVQDLNATDRSLTPWLVAMFHCPWHNSNLEHQGERQAMTAMRAMEPVLFRHRTSFVISGHVHGAALAFVRRIGSLYHIKASIGWLGLETSPWPLLWFLLVGASKLKYFVQDFTPEESC